MSEDIFKDLEDDYAADSSGNLFDTPTELSGVSGKVDSNSNSPGSQRITGSNPVPEPPSEPVQPVQPQKNISTGAVVTGVPVGFTFIPPQTKCGVCRRLLKTKIGFDKHMDRHKELGIYVPPAEAATVTPAAQVEAANPTVQQQLSAKPKEVFVCAECKKTLQSKPGFVRHMAAHRLQALYQNKPSMEEFHPHLPDVCTKIADEILAEPLFNEECKVKKNFMEEFKTNIGTPQWFDFVAPLSDFICDAILNKSTKLLPSNQYEEAQQNLFAYLSDNEVMMTLSDKLQDICVQDLNSKLLDRLVFRIAQKLIGRIQVWVTSKLMERRLDGVDQVVQSSSESSVMEEREKKAFLQNLGELFRAFFKKGIVSELSQWQTTSACLLSKFVDCQQQPISTINFLNKMHWFSGDENNIIISQKAEDFFIAVEKIIPRESDVSVDLVVGKIFQNVSALNNWFYLTNAHFSEEKSLLFLKDLVRVYLQRSLLMREKLANRSEEKSIRASTAALRENMKTNYVEKGNDEAVIN